MAAAFKMIAYGDSGETAQEALAFTEYGYNGNLPSPGLPWRPSGVTVDATHDLLDWCWEPYKPRNPDERRR